MSLTQLIVLYHIIRCGYMFRPVMWSSSVHSCTWNQNDNWKFHFGV